MTTKKTFTKEDLERAFEDGRLYDAGELELNTIYHTAFDAWLEMYLTRNNRKIKYAIGDIVRINKSFLGDPANVLGYVYEEYGNIGTDYYGVSIITENGTDLGGFSIDEQDMFLEFVRKTDYHYKFSNVIQLDRDFETRILPIFTH